MHHLMLSLLLAILSVPLLANSIINESELNQTATGQKAPTAEAEDTGKMTSVFAFNETALRLMLTTMQKQGKGEIMSQPKFTVADKEQGTVSSILRGYFNCDNIDPPKPNPYDYDLMVTPEIVPDGKVKLYVKFTLYDHINNTQQKKDFIKVVNDEQAILLDELIMPIPGRKDHLLLIFISPQIKVTLYREFIVIKYVDANKIIAAFTKQYLTAAKDRGSIGVKEKTNTIIADLTEKNLEKLRQLVVEMDVPVKKTP